MPRAYDEDDAPPPRPQSSGGGKTVLIVVLSILGGLGLLGCLGVAGCVALLRQAGREREREAHEVVTAAAPATTAEALHAEYEANEIAADAKYKGKILEVTGTIGEIGKGLGDQFVTLQRGPAGFAGVRCSFGEAAQAELAKLRKGERVTIKGRVSGYLIGTVTLRDCVLVK